MAYFTEDYNTPSKKKKSISQQMTSSMKKQASKLKTSIDNTMKLKNK